MGLVESRVKSRIGTISPPNWMGLCTHWTSDYPASDPTILRNIQVLVFSHIDINSEFGIGVKIIPNTSPIASPLYLSMFRECGYCFCFTSYFK